MKTEVTYFSNVTDQIGRIELLDQDELSIQFGKFLPSSNFTENTNNKIIKTKIPCFITGVFDSNGRKKKNLLYRTMIVLDIDYCAVNNITLNALSNLLDVNYKDYKYYAYSTISHSLENPKVRIVFPITKNLTGNEYERITKNFIDKYPNIAHLIDEASYKSCVQLMCIPIKPSNDYIEWYKYNEGTMILDITEYDYHSLPVKKTISKTVIKNKEEVNSSSVKYIYSDEEVMYWLSKYEEASCNYDEWLEVGEALHYQYKGSNFGRSVWEQWSKKYKASLDNIENIPYKWSTFDLNKENPKTFSSIKYKLKLIGVDKSSIPLPSYMWLHTKGTKRIPLTTYENFKIMLKYYNINIFFDVIKKRDYVEDNGEIIFDANSSLTKLKSLCIQNHLNKDMAHEYLVYEGLKNSRNTWKELIEASPNTKTNNFDLLCDTIEVLPEYEEAKRIYLKKWLMQMLHMTCLNDGELPKSARLILVFQGKQEVGKTSWLRSLVPPKYSHYIGEAKVLDAKSDMKILECVQHPIVELGELSATFRISDMEQFKGFVSQVVDMLNIKYRPMHAIYRRRTVFFATVDKHTFLRDPAGSTRFLVLPIIKTKYDHNIDTFALFSEMLEEARKGHNYNLTPEEKLMQLKINSEFEDVVPLKELFEEVFYTENTIIHTDKNEFDNAKSSKKYSSTQVLIELGYRMPINKKDSNLMANILKQYDFPYSKREKKWSLRKKQKESFWNS
jgi:hypothetical protein